MNLQYTISIQKNTNKLISSSVNKFLGVGIGDLIKIDNEPIIHTITGKDSFLYIKDFTIENSKTIIIDEDVSINLQKSDILKFTYKEYEAKFITKIINEGINYFPTDSVQVKNGTLSIDVYSGAGEPTIFNINEVNSSGGVQNIEITKPGKYIEPPQNPIEIHSKRGENLLLDVKYMDISNRSIIERTITDIHVSNNKTYIILDYSLPLNVKEGKISCEKTTLSLMSNYTGETKRNIGYQIFTHFTPNLHLPLLIKNSLSSEAVLNKALLIIDEEIGKIKQKLEIN